MISLSIEVGPGGEVNVTTASVRGQLPDSVVSCVRARAQAAQFDPPSGGKATVAVPVTFVKQDDSSHPNFERLPARTYGTATSGKTAAAKTTVSVSGAA